jgi:hypothetical protein
MNNTTATATYNAVAGYVEVTLSDGTILKSKKGKNAAKALYLTVTFGTKSNPNWAPRIDSMQTSLTGIQNRAAHLADCTYNVEVVEVTR